MYEKFYGFSQEPFNPSPDPKFLYLTPTHSEAFSAMLSGIRERKAITVITGEPGTGKTTLIQALLSDLDKNVKTALVFFTNIGFKDLLKNILYELEIPVKGEDASGLLEKFYRYLSERPQNETVAIIIDEAQGLKTSVLKDLLRLWDSPDLRSGLLQTVLVGQPELKTNLDSTELRDLRKRIAAQCHIRPLTLKESKAYIDHRLRIVGSSSSKVLRPEVVDRICDFAKGIPRTINMVCDAALLIGYAKSRHEIDAKIIKEAVNDLSLFEPAKTVESLPGSIQTEEQTPATPMSEPAKGPAKTLSKHVPAAEALSEVTRSEKPRRIKPLHGILAGSILAALLLGLFALWTSERAPRTETVNIPPVQEGSVEKKDTATVAIAEKGSTLSLLAKKHYGAANPTVIDLILEANPQITDVHLIRLNQKIAMPRISDESLLIPGPGNTYKIHVGTFLKKPALRSFDDQPALQGKTTEIISRPVSSRQTWYRVLAGPFKTREEGLSAIQALRNRGLVPPLSASSS